MSVIRYLPAKDRLGRRAWLGPLSLCLGIISWVIPAGGLLVGLAGVACGIASISTDRQYRIDWMAVTGSCAGAGQTLVSLMLLVATGNG